MNLLFLPLVVKTNLQFPTTRNLPSTQENYSYIKVKGYTWIEVVCCLKLLAFVTDFSWVVSQWGSEIIPPFSKECAVWKGLLEIYICFAVK